MSSRIKLALALVLAMAWLTTASSLRADTLITNARIIDGTGSPAMIGSSPHEYQFADSPQLVCALL